MAINLWTCNKCERQFARKNQTHTCTKIKPLDHLKGKSEKVKRLYQSLKALLLAELPVRFDAISFAINMSARAQFGMIFIQKDKIKVEFKLAERITHPRIQKTAKMNGTIVHVAIIENQEEIDDQLLDWLKQAYLYKS
ncbi:MAG: DUF5655 domain-containing protein [Candidatus Thorarchaeota archaeon]